MRVTVLNRSHNTPLAHKCFYTIFIDMRKLAAQVWFIPLLVCLIGAGTSCHRGPPNPGLGLQDHLVSRILGQNVENIDGQEMAQLDDLLLDLHSGRVKFAILASGGFLGLGKRHKAVPWQVLTSETTKKDVLALDVSKGTWDQAPSLRSESGLNNPVLATTVENYYRRAAVPDKAEGTPESRPALASTGHNPEGTSGSRSARLKSVRGLKGRPVVNRQAQRLGRLVDLLVDLSGRHRPAYGIVSFDLPGSKSKWFAVPVQLLNEAEHGPLVIDANRGMFETAKRFNPTYWQSNRIEIGNILRLSAEESAGEADPVPSFATRKQLQVATPLR